jgi:hypothetical protein
MRRQAQHLAPGDAHRPLPGDEPGDRIAERGLAHAVAAHDREHAALERERHRLQRVRAAVVDVEVLDREQRGASGGHQWRCPM